MRFLAAATLAAIMCWASPADAAWYKAETDGFVVYGSGRETAVRDYAVKLQTFDTVLRLYHPETLKRVPATKVQVFLVAGAGGLRRVQPRLPPNIAGFYTAMNEGVFALATTGDTGWDDKYDTIFHEYAHHFMLENFPAAYPAWVIEGFAEYFMTADITPAGVKVGGYNNSRVYEVLSEPWLPMDELLSKSVFQVRSDRRGAFYSQAWLLTHYMRSDPARSKQFNRIVMDIAKGDPPVKAFETESGVTMAELTKALKGYNKLPVVIIKGGIDQSPHVSMTQLPPSADTLLLDQVRLILAPTGVVDANFLADVRRKAAKFPSDDLAELTLARAEFVMGDVTAGEAIISRRLTAAPDDFETLLLAGVGQICAGIRATKERETRFRAARAPLIKAYGLRKTDFRTLYAYAVARSIEPGFPNENDLNALLEARGLAPSVAELSIRAGEALMRRGQKELAIRYLTPVINNPHGGTAAAQARAVLEGKSATEVEAAGNAAEEPDKTAQPAKKED